MSSILEGLVPMAYVFGAFSVIYITDILFTAVVGLIDSDAGFDWQAILRSFLRIVVSAATMVLIVIAFNLIALGLNEFDEQISRTLIDAVSVGTFILLFSRGFVQTALGVYEKLKDLFEIGDEIYIETGGSN